MNFTKLKISLGLSAQLGIQVVMVLLMFMSIPDNILSWDTFGYYLYLPSAFIYNEIGLMDTSFVHEVIAKYDNTATFYQASPGPEGGMIIKYSLGLAILFLPFFLLGHMYALLTAFPADGFSLPYQYAIIASSLSYTLAGIYFIRKVLHHFFKDIHTAILLLLLVFGTNYLHINVYGSGSIHLFLFTLYALLLWYVIRWHNSPDFFNTGMLALATGLIVVTRPTDIVCLLIPLLWGIHNKSSLFLKLNFLGNNYSKVLFGGLIILLIGFPQLIYWKMFTGEWFYYSYNNNGEGLDFLSPYIDKVLFSFRKGWLVYTPVMAFSIIGIYSVYRNKKDLFLPVLLFFIFNLYLVSSWTCWWYAGSFSQRAMVQSYAVMIIPMGFFIQHVLSSKKFFRYVVFVLMAILVLLNLFQTWQYNNRIIHMDRMTREYYFAVFGSFKEPKEEVKKLLLVERSATDKEIFNNQEDYSMRQEWQIEFENEDEIHSKQMQDTVVYSGTHAAVLTSDHIYTRAFEKQFTELTDKDHSWVKISAYVYPTADPVENPFSLVVTFDHKEKNYKYRAYDSEKYADRLVPNKWNKVEMVYLTPEVRTKNDQLRVYFWLRGKENIFVDMLSIQVYTKINQGGNY